MNILQRLEAAETELANIRKEMLENIKREIMDGWQPKRGDDVAYINSAGQVWIAPYYDTVGDKACLAQGNIKRTREEAEHKAARDRAVEEWNKLAGSQEWLEWNTVYKFRPHLKEGIAQVSCNCFIQSWPFAHFKTKTECQAAIDKMGQDKMKLLFEGC